MTKEEEVEEALDDLLRSVQIKAHFLGYEYRIQYLRGKEIESAIHSILEDQKEGVVLNQ